MRNTPIPWPTTAQNIKPAGQQQRQSDKQHQQKDEQHDQDDENGFGHIDEYA